METSSSLFAQPPGYRLPPAAASHRHVTSSRQSQSIPDVTSQSRDAYRVAAGSRGFDWAGAVPAATLSQSERILDVERVRRLLSSSADSVGTRYNERHTATSAGGARPPTTTSATYSLPRDLSYVGRAAGEVMAPASTATSRLFSCASAQHPPPHHRHCHHHPHHHPQQFHEPSYSAPADCTAPPPPPYRRRPAAVPATCGPGVRATKVSVRTKYHLTTTTTTRRPSSSGGVNDAQRSQSSRSQLGASLWVGVAQTIDIRPVTATAITATVDCNNRELAIHYTI